jgi:ribose transport system ATP-binding protein
VTDSSGLVIRNLSKAFSGERVLSRVSVEFPRGAITALLGQNGSGKSTLIKVLAGFHAPEPGAQIVIDGEELRLPVDAQEAYRRGLRFVHQDLGLVGPLSIADNFAFSDRFLARTTLSPISRKREHARVSRVLANLGIDLDPAQSIDSLSPTMRTMVAIARAVQDEDGLAEGGRHVVILDEPTAALPHEEVLRVLDLVRTISKRGGAVIYVSHRIDEVLSVADRMVVLRNGHVVAVEDVHEAVAANVIDIIIGRAGGELETESDARATREIGDVVLSLAGISGPRLRDVGLDLRAGEILGVAGLVGCGRSELARIMSGAQRAVGGSMRLGDADYAPDASADALASGVVYVPQDRRRDGCITAMSFQENLSLGTLGEFTRRPAYLDAKAERHGALAAARRFSIVPPDPRRLVAQFSGGNQQKIVLAKAMRHQPRVLVLDEPMQGVDVGAREEIAQIVREVAARGVGVVVASTDVEDLVGLCDRVALLNRGRMTQVVEGADITKQRLVAVMSRPSQPPDSAGPSIDSKAVVP